MTVEQNKERRAFMETKFLTMRYYLEQTVIGEDSTGSFWAVDAVSPSAFSPDFGDDFDAVRPLTPTEVSTLQTLQAMEQGKSGLRVYGPSEDNLYIIGHNSQHQLFCEASPEFIQRISDKEIALLSDLPGNTTLDMPLVITRIDDQLIVY